MSSSATGIPDHSSHCKANSGRQPNHDADCLASLAVLTMTRQAPGLVLPSLSGVPTSYSVTKGNDNALKLARSLTTLGLGSADIWKRTNGNLSVFIRNSLNAWLKTIGASDLQNKVSIDFAIIDDLESQIFRAEAVPDGKLLILLETNDGCGFITIGNQIDLLEEEALGLGRAYYSVLMGALYSWMRIYDSRDAEEYVDRWKESIEMDMEHTVDDENDSGEEQTLSEYCADTRYPYSRCRRVETLLPEGRCEAVQRSKDVACHSSSSIAMGLSANGSSRSFR